VRGCWKTPMDCVAFAPPRPARGQDWCDGFETSGVRARCLHPSVLGRPAAPTRKAKKMRTEQEWQRAQHRLILYLRLLDLPALHALQVATETLQRAQREASCGQGNVPPVTLTMRSMRKVLEELKGKTPPGPEGEDLFRLMCPWSPPPEEGDIPGAARSMPAIHRGSMVPETY
jgi:hypothetical protein